MNRHNKENVLGHSHLQSSEHPSHPNQNRIPRRLLRELISDFFSPSESWHRISLGRVYSHRPKYNETTSFIHGHVDVYTHSVRGIWYSGSKPDETFCFWASRVTSRPALALANLMVAIFFLEKIPTGQRCVQIF